MEAGSSAPDSLNLDLLWRADLFAPKVHSDNSPGHRPGKRRREKEA